MSAFYRLLAEKICTLIVAKIQAGKGLAFLVNTAKKGRPGVSCGGTAAAALPPFRLGDHTGAPLWEPALIVTP